MFARWICTKVTLRSSHTQIHIQMIRKEGIVGEGGCDGEAVTDMWQGGTDQSLDELITSPRSVCQGLALSLCQAWVAS